MRGVAYTSTVVAHGHVVAGILAGVVVGCVAGSWPVAVGAVLVSTAAGVHLGSVRLAVGPEGLVVTAGRWGRGRRIPRAAIRSASASVLDRWQTLGVGLPWRARTTRLTVRPGPTLVVDLTDGEILRISTPDPVCAAALATPIREDPR